MISSRWQRRSSRSATEEVGAGLFARIGGRLSAIATSAMFQAVHPGTIGKISDQADNGPFGRLGPNTAHAVKEGIGAAGRTASAPFGALVTLTVADEFVRVLTARGNRVRAWAESDLPVGVVQGGLIVDEITFIEVLGGVLEQVSRNGKLKGQKVAVAITGRNMVQRRLTVYVEDDQDLAEAIIEASSESMSIRTEEMEIEWDAEALDLIDDEDEDDLGDDEFDDEDEGAVEDADVAGVDAGDGLSDSTVGGDIAVAAAQPPIPTEELGLENLDLDLGPEPDGDPYDVYALALHRHVIRRNLRTVSDFGARFAGVQPKILALAAAVNSRAAVIVDIESDTLITAVVSDGLPEVIREVGIERSMTHAGWVELITTQISRAITFYDSIFPEEPLDADVEVFATGQTDRVKDAVDEALEKLPYTRSELPQTLRAPADFPFDKYAANVGLVLVSGKRFWQRAPVSLLPTPKFDYRPQQYRPRPLPIRAMLQVAAALILSFGLLSTYEVLGSQTDSVSSAQRTVATLEQQVQLRNLKVEKTREARTLLDDAKSRTERLIAADDVIQDRDAGFAETISIITGVAPPEVRLVMVDDDGAIVAVEAEAPDYSTLLMFIRLLEDVPQFEHVQVLSLGQQRSAGLEDLLDISEMGGSGVSEPLARMSVQISRVFIEESQLPSDEELAIEGIGGK